MLVQGGSRCELHPLVQWAKRHGRDGNTTQRGYGHAWRKLRKLVLERDGYLCQVAKAEGRLEPATEVDHKINKALWLQLHGTLDGVDDPSNLQAINAVRHALKTRAEAQVGATGAAVLVRRAVAAEAGGEGESPGPLNR
ncbi:HNH endonuclease [Rhizobacter sp. Root1221]|uniref:HNH endonuclease n=1 Tax=Rhizobacter sp. Root1221 TaxID=1736433 RepID=UPI0006F72EC9|nr:HNH endonuclease [Rhizobacter sp. Root1221]KQV85446.1 hypothetical protein ASC87_07080 [Rhizobacter sp. Root1221]